MVVKLGPADGTVFAAAFNELDDAEPVECVCTGQLPGLDHTFLANGALLLRVVGIFDDGIAGVDVCELHLELSQFIYLLRYVSDQLVQVLHHEYLRHREEGQREGTTPVHQ